MPPAMTPTLTLELRSAPLAWLWLGLLGSLALGACVLLPLPRGLRVALAVGVSVWWLWALWCEYRGGCGGVSALRWRDGWEVTSGDGWRRAWLEHAVVWPQVVVMRLRTDRGAVDLWLPPGRAPVSGLRRLRVLLRHGPVWG